MNSLPKTELTSSSKGLVNGSTDSKTAPTLPTNTGTNFGDKTLLDESQATIPTTAYSEPTSPKVGLPGKNKRMSRMKKLGPKGLFSLFSCFTLNNDGVDEKTLDQPEKSSSPSPPTSSPRTSSSDVKPSLGDLIYSAVPGQSQPSTPVTPLPLRKDEKRLSLISKKHLLEPLLVEHHGRKCLVLDLDETLVHSSFKPIDNPDFVVPVEIDNQVHSVYVLKRPGVDEFLKRVGEVFEVVVFTASLAKYADPVMDILDIHRVVKHRLFRESCYNHNGNYVKDLSQLGRDLKHTIIIDNSPTSYLFHPNNAVPITTWFSDLHDNELVDLVPFLCDLATVDDVTKVLDASFSDHD